MDYLNKYTSPSAEIIDTQYEGILCGSNESVGENEGSDWDNF
jgi:hypothetical protein